MVDKISSADSGYQPGDLSYFPETKDNWDSLYKATNNSETKLKQSLSFGGKTIIVDDNSGFPPTGIIKIGPPAGESGNYELVYYQTKGQGFFKNLKRGFAGTVQTTWGMGSYVSNSVVSEHHLAIRDAIMQIEKKLGTKTNPEEGSLTQQINSLDVKYLSPKPIFRAFPTKGAPPLTVTFQNFSLGNGIRWFWDFGDGTSIDENPTHTYNNEGIYSVKLNMTIEEGGQAIAFKTNYITVSEKEALSFFYISQVNDGPAYSEETATLLAEDPAVFMFMDQTDGDISERHWIFGDGETISSYNPQNHFVTHTYAVPGDYNPTLILIYSDSSSKRVFLQESVTIL
jgi:PKD repeat protein